MCNDYNRLIEVWLVKVDHELIPGDVWIALMGSGDFSHNGIGCVLPTMNVSHVYIFAVGYCSRVLYMF